MKADWALILLVPLVWNCSEAPRASDGQDGTTLIVYDSASGVPSTSNALVGGSIEPAAIVGLRHGPEPLPSGFEDRGGVLLDPAGKSEYALKSVAAQNQEMIWLNWFTYHDAAGKPHWEVRAVLQLPALRDDEMVSYGGNCLINGERDPEIIAVVLVEEDEELLTNIRQAWRVNLSLEKFEEIPTSGVVCENEIYIYGFD
jgi:hypothetical protein